MKIIKPILIEQEDFTSTAQSEGNEVWAPVGRDFLTNRDFEAVAAQGDTGYFGLYSSDTKVYRVTLSTGAVDAFETGEPNVSNIVPSPDGLYFSVTTKPTPSTFRVTVYRISDGADVYSFDAPTQTRTHNDWSFDAGLFLHSFTATGNLADLRLYSVNTTSWTLDQQSATYQAIAQAVTGEAGLFPSFFDGQVIAAHKDADFCSIIYLAQFSAAGQPSVYEHLLIRFQLSNMTYTSRVLRSGSFASPYYRLIHNPERSELILFFPNAPQAVSDSTLADAGLSPSLPAVDEVSVSADNSEMIFRARSTTPKFNRIATLDYSSNGALDSILVDTGRSAVYSDDFYLFTMESGGYALIDILTEALETETNPSVNAGDVYQYQENNYEALSATTDRPDQGAVADPPTWLDLGPINPLRMFDGKLDTLTTTSSPLIVEITADAITNGIALFNVSASIVRVQMIDPDDGEVYDSGDIPMIDNSTITGWYEFFFGTRLQKSDVARLDLPPYKNATIVLTLTTEGGNVSVGECVLGRTQNLGAAQYGTNVGIIDFSRKDVDPFGNFVITKRRFSKRAEYDVKIPTSQNAGVQRTLANLRTTPIVWIGDETKEETVVYGYYRNFEILLEGPSLSDATITVEGL